MTPAEEDALVQSCDTGAPMPPVHANAIRLAIRAANEAGRLEGAAQERERCAKIVDVPPGTEAWEVIGGEEGLTMQRDLAAAQEARERAEARVKSLVLDLSAAIGRYQRAEERAAACENDAQRYRWLRNPTLPVAIWINNELPFAVDTVIDAAIAARAK